MMTKHLLIVYFVSILHFMSMAQSKKTIYLIPGQGADKRIFDSLSLDTSVFKIKYLEYGTPNKNMSMNEFAIHLAKEIDTTEEFILIGVSLGGMLCVELSEMLNPEKTIIISSAKNRTELPFRYKFQKKVPLNAIVPGRVILGGAKILQPIVEPDRNNNKETFKSMLYSKSPKYMKRTVNKIINWERTKNRTNIIHIHGDNDHTIPIRNIESPDYIIKNGSHMMTLTRAEEISEILNDVLNK
jgi:pimeloyl-ACP methyl ester carboxylesterase